MNQKEDLSELMVKLKTGDFLCDETVQGLAECISNFRRNGGWEYEERSLKQVRAFTAERASLNLQHLKKIRNDIEDGAASGIRWRWAGNAKLGRVATPGVHQGK